MESPLLRLPVEIRERIWSMVLGGGLLHLKFESPFIYDSETDELLSTRSKPVWSANYCLLKDAEQHSNAIILVKAVDDDQDPTDSGDEHPHRNCHLARLDPYVYALSKNSNKTQDFVEKYAKPYLQLLRTCRQIYLEASRVLWTTNTFSFSSPGALKMFMNDRKTAQKQLLKNLHLDMAWHWNNQKHNWEKALTMTLVRSLKGLKTFHLYIEQCLLNRDFTFADKPDWETDVLSDSYFAEIMKLKMLPLETVTVNIANGKPYPHNEELPPWPLAGRTEWAERMKSQLLDPEGAARWQDHQEHQKELVRQEKEELAQAHARTTCYAFSTEEKCAENNQKRQDDKDKRTGRVRKEKKVAGPCGRKHVCLICFWKGDIASDEAARNCPRPGHCNEVEETTI
jgi:hypothetical protein